MYNNYLYLKEENKSKHLEESLRLYRDGFHATDKAASLSSSSLATYV